MQFRLMVSVRGSYTCSNPAFSSVARFAPAVLLPSWRFKLNL